MNARRPRGYLIPLRLGARREAFVKVGPEASVVVTVPLAKTSSTLLVSSAADGIRIDGVAKLSEVELHPSTPLVVGGYLILGAGAAVALKSATAVDRLEVSYDVSSSDGALSVRPRHTPTAVIPCSALDLGVGVFDVPLADGKVAEDARLASNRDVPLSATPGGPTVATIRSADRLVVGVSEKRDRAARIVFERGLDTVVGWVPRRALSKPGEEDGIGPVGTLGQGAGIGRGTWLGGTVVCPHAVPLVVEQDARRSTVGTVDAGTTVNLVKWRSGAAEIGLRTTGFSETDGVPFLFERVPRDCRIRER